MIVVAGAEQIPELRYIEVLIQWNCEDIFIGIFVVYSEIITIITLKQITRLGELIAISHTGLPGIELFTINGKEYLLEKPLRADIALLGATIADEDGNLVYVGTTQNFNPLMATAADVVIVEAEKVVKVGEIAPEQVHTPAMFVDYIYAK